MGMSYEPHPISRVFPLLDGKELATLAEDIRTNGLNNPIVLFEGKILDGRNRAAACQMAGIAVQTREFTGGFLDAAAFVWSENIIRRHLNPGQTAIARALFDRFVKEGQERLELQKTEARERQKEGRKTGGKTAGRGRPKDNSFSQLIDQSFPDHNANRTTAIRAKEAGTNREYLNFADRLIEEYPDAAEQVHSGKKTLPQVKRELKRAEVIAKVAALPSEKFRVLYADPPWKYGSSSPGLDQYGPAERHYPSMAISELCALGISDIAENDAVLFLWVTSPLLDECWPVVKAWGFEYKTSFVWDKVKHNFGHYNSLRHEFLLVCTRGSCTPDVKQLFDSVQTIERDGDHSQKPEEFRRIIDTLYPHGKRIELFARKTAPGWEAYGNEL